MDVGLKVHAFDTGDRFWTVKTVVWNNNCMCYEQGVKSKSG